MNVLTMIDRFADMADWQEELERSCESFHRQFRVHPNIVVVNGETYGRILTIARRYPTQWRNYDEGRGETEPCFETGEEALVPDGWRLELFACRRCTLAFAIDERLGDGRYRIVFDAEPDFDGGIPAGADAYRRSA